MTRRYDTVSLLTDLGSRDEAAGVVRAVLHDLAPHARVIDLTHDIDPFDVRAGALALVRAIAYVPAGVVLASIDPGAGTERRAIAVEIAGGEGVVIGPDNGLLAPAIALTGGAERAVLLTNPAFHPRHRARPSPLATSSLRRGPPVQRRAVRRTRRAGRSGDPAPIGHPPASDRGDRRRDGAGVRGPVGRSVRQRPAQRGLRRGRRSVR
ncbi:MAG: SAM-dependent chlorinase/fluorinase [Ilumatobacteraceae bacterium]